MYIHFGSDGILMILEWSHLYKVIRNWWYKRKGGWFYAKKEVANIE